MCATVNCVAQPIRDIDWRQKCDKRRISQPTKKKEKKRRKLNQRVNLRGNITKKRNNIGKQKIKYTRFNTYI